MNSTTSGNSLRFSGAIVTFFLAFILATSGSLNAQQPALDAAPFSLDAKALLQAASASPKEKRADVLVLTDEKHIVVDEHGRAKETTHIIYRVDTQAGVENWATLEVAYYPWRQARPVVRARVVTADGVQHDLDTKTFSDNAVKSDGNVFSDEHSYEGPFPAVAVGAVVEEEIVIQDTAPLFEGVWSEAYGVGRGQPVLKTKIVVETPASMPLRYKAHLLPELKAEKAEANGRLTYAFDYGRMDPVDAEPLLPPDVPRRPHLTMTTAKSWKDLAASYSKRAEPQIRTDEVKTLVAGVSGKDDATISRLLAKLHANARYTGLEFGEAGLTPYTPAETLKRKYGDCKDKATLLVSMLRAVGIPANLALLNSGTGKDVDPDMPGMSWFNHAIVYLPGKDLFIDGTTEYSRVGELPTGDQGRWALVITEDTSELKRIPVLPTNMNRAVEQREFFLEEYGPARVVETTQWFGDIESYFRSSYDGAESKELKKKFDSYVAEQYLADAAGKFEHSDVSDLGKHFSLRLEVPKAKRGNTGISDAVVAIRLADMVADLFPADLRKDDKDDKKDQQVSDDEKADAKPPRTKDWYLTDVYQQEWDYKIVPPPGYSPRSLPENKTMKFGPAVLTQEFRPLQDGRVEAVIKFDLAKNRYTVAEVGEVRAALKQFNEHGILFIYFDLKANTLLQQGKVREALAAFRSLTALHPKEGLHRAQLARAYLAVSLGEMARSEAQQAVKLDPKSAIAYDTLGWVLMHDLVGRAYKRGFDPEGAAAAYRKAVELDPKEPSYAIALGESLEYDVEGNRYSPEAKLDDAVAVYRELKKNEDADANSVNEHLLFALAYARRFAELRDALASIGNNKNANALRVLATAGLEGGAAAVKKSAEISADEKSRSDVLATSGSMMVRLRHYPEAAEMLATAATGQPNASAMANLAALLPRVRKYETIEWNDNDPVSFALHIMSRAGDRSKRSEIVKAMSRASHELPPGTDAEIAKQNWTTSFSDDLPAKVMMDITLATLKVTAEGEDATGYRISLQTPGKRTDHLYLVKENGALKLLCEYEQLAPLGQEVLDRIARNDLKGAKVLLDWVREDLKLIGGEDPHAGPTFPRVWTKGQEADAGLMRAAGLVLVSWIPGAATPHIAAVEAAREKATSDAERAKYDEALLRAYASVKDWAKMERVAAALLARAESARIFSDMASSLQNQKKWAELAKLIEQHQGKLSDETTTADAQANGYFAQAQPLKAMQVLKALIDSGKGDAHINNQYGWAAVIAGEVTPEALDLLQQTVQQPSNQTYNILHTLGCMNAKAGRAAQAQQTLLDAMKHDTAIDEPESSIWYGFGLLAESYGERDAASSLYRKVEKPKFFEPGESSTYLLAQRRLSNINTKEGM